MPQFGHIYALQREMAKTSNSWFRAAELWHIARNEGVPYSSHNYAHILRICNRDRQWKQALQICTQMRREGVTFETDCMQEALAACMQCGQWEATLELHKDLKAIGVYLNDMCLISILKALRMQQLKNPDASSQICQEATQALSTNRLHEPSLLLESEITGLLEELPALCEGREDLVAISSRSESEPQLQQSLPHPSGH